MFDCLCVCVCALFCYFGLDTTYGGIGILHTHVFCVLYCVVLVLYRRMVVSFTYGLGIDTLRCGAAKPVLPTT